MPIIYYWDSTYASDSTAYRFWNDDSTATATAAFSSWHTTTSPTSATTLYPITTTSNAVYSVLTEPALVVEPERPRLVLPAPAIIAEDRAKKRAMGLLLAYLTPEQRATFRAHGWFVVQGGKTRTRYRIRGKEGLIANIDVLADNDNTVRYRLCGHCRHGEVPFGDQLLGQKLMLELDEDHFVGLANRHAA